MSLRVTVAAPFKASGGKRMREQAFVVALAIDRGWMSPDQAKEVVELATERGLLRHTDGELVVDFDLDAVTVPDGFAPDASIFTTEEPFEQALDALVAAGATRRETVAAINALQEELQVTADAAAIVYARREGIDVSEAAADTMQTLKG
ncbi:MAG: DUF2240 family protein [Halodesulfurarchaeum sp.]